MPGNLALKHVLSLIHYIYVVKKGVSRIVKDIVSRFYCNPLISIAFMLCDYRVLFQKTVVILLLLVLLLKVMSQLSKISIDLSINIFKVYLKHNFSKTDIVTLPV